MSEEGGGIRGGGMLGARLYGGLSWGGGMGCYQCVILAGWLAWDGWVAQLVWAAVVADLLELIHGKEVTVELMSNSFLATH